MKPDQKIVVFIISIAFACVVMGMIAPPLYKLVGLSGEGIIDRGLTAAGFFVAILARTRADTQAVTVQQPASDPIPTVETKTNE